MIIERFGTLNLPIYDPETDISPNPAQSGLMDLPDGFFDVYGSDRAPSEKTTLSKRCVLIESTPIALQSALDELRSWRGKRDRLYARMRDGSVRWLYARLQNINIDQRHNDVLRQPVDLNFELLTDTWNGEDHGAVWYFDSGESFDTGLVFDVAVNDVFTLTAGSSVPNNLTINNGGNVAVKNLIIKIRSVTTAITGVAIGDGKDHSFQYLGTIAIGKELEIDCGAWSVKNDGTEDYDNFMLSGSHESDEWLSLEPGDNPIYITLTGGGTDSIATFEFHDGWV